MAISEDKRSELHHADEARKIQDLSVWIASVEDAGEVKELCTLIYLCPKTLLDGFLCDLQSRLLLDQIQMRKNTDDFREAVSLQDV